jgi:hypothetical protein
VTGLAERVDLERISDQAREVHAGRFVLSLIAALFIGIGWVARMVFLGAVWCAFAVQAGWTMAGERPGVSRGPAS